MAGNPNTIKAGARLSATSSLPCPKCQRPVEIEVKLSIENLLTMSMVLWAHDQLAECSACGTKLVPIIAEFDSGAIRWSVSAVRGAVEEPLIKAPNHIDISNILR